MCPTPPPSTATPSPSPSPTPNPAQTADPDVVPASIGLFVQKVSTSVACSGGNYTAAGGGASITCEVPSRGSETLLFGVSFLKGAPGSFAAITGCDATCQAATGQPASSPLKPLGLNVPSVFIGPSCLSGGVCTTPPVASTYTGLTTTSICEPNRANNPNFPTVPKTANCINYARGDGKLTGLQFGYNGRAAKGTTEVITFQQSTETIGSENGPDLTGPTGAGAFYPQTITINFI